MTSFRVILLLLQLRTYSPILWRGRACAAHVWGMCSMCAAHVQHVCAVCAECVAWVQPVCRPGSSIWWRGGVHRVSRAAFLCKSSCGLTGMPLPGAVLLLRAWLVLVQRRRGRREESTEVGGRERIQF